MTPLADRTRYGGEFVRNPNPGDRVRLISDSTFASAGEVGTVVCVHSYPDRDACSDVRLKSGRLLLIANGKPEKVA